MRRVAIISGSSVSGRSCAEALLAKAPPGSFKVRACFRSAESASNAASSLALPPTSPGSAPDMVETMVGVDAGDMGSLHAAMEDVDVAVIVTPLDHQRGFGEDAQLSVNMVKAAQAANVKRVVHVGSWTVKAPERLPGLASRFKRTEDYLLSTCSSPEGNARREGEEGTNGDLGLEWTVLRGGYFLNNVSAMFGSSLSGGSSSIAFPSVAVAPVDTRDIGEAAAALCLLDSGPAFAPYNRRFLECSGPALLTFADVATALEASLGRPVGFEDMGVEEWCQGKPPPMQELMRYMHQEGSQAVPFAPHDLEPLLGRPPRSIHDWLADHKHKFMP